MLESDAQDPTRKTDIARQRFDIPHWIESQLAEVTLPIAVCEIVDNALDETITGQKASVSITFDAHSKSITFENRRTLGMDFEKMKEYPLWGGEHQDPEKIREHRLGGKLAALFLLSKEMGSLAITSKPAGSDILYRMEIANWWKKLSPEEVFTVESVQTQETETGGRTTFELTDAKEDLIPTNLTELAEYLGLVYGPLIESRKLSIKLRRISKGGKSLERIEEVFPITVPFKGDRVKSKSNVPTGRKGGGPRISVVWGQIDPEEKDSQETARRAYYGKQNVHQIQGDSLYLYYHGRLLSLLRITDLRIAGYTAGKAANHFLAIVANIEKGWVPKTILKTALRATSPETKDIISKIVNLVGQDLIDLTKEADTEKVPEIYRSKIQEASRAFKVILTQMFENNIQLIAETFGIPDWEYIEVPKKTAEKPDTQEQETTAPVLPHLKPYTGKPRQGQQPSQPEKDTTRKPVWRNPVPELSISPFAATFPEAQLTIDEETRQPVILLNYKNPIVLEALKQKSKGKGAFWLKVLLRLGAQALFHEKWIKLEDKDSRKYAEGLEKDVSNFLNIAVKL